MSAPLRAATTATSSPRFGRLAGAVLMLSTSFVLSRVLGVLRNSVIAATFGNTRAVEAYFAAFRIPDTIFMLVSGGALASAFVPMFAGLLESGDQDAAWRVANTVVTTVFLALAAMAVVAWIFAPQIMGVLVANYTVSERDLTVQLTRIMLLQPIFLGIAAIQASMLQTFHRFTLTAVAPLLYNLAIILGAWLLGGAYGVRALSWAVVVGAVAQLAVQAPGLPELRSRFHLSLDWNAPGAREVLRLFGPRLVGLAAFQIMLLITLYLAQGLPAGNVAAINYAWPLIMFPVGALGTAAATAIFPTLARLTAAEDFRALRRTVNRGLRLVLFLALPCTFGLIVLRRPVINLLYNHGHWSSLATEQTAFALVFYAMALASLSVIEVIARVFYAMKDTVTPVKIALVAVAIDAVLSVFFVHVFPKDSAQGGLALATAVANTVQALWLARALDGYVGGIGLRGLSLTLRDAAIASVVMGLAVYVFLFPLTAVLPQRGFGVLCTVICELVIAGASFTSTVYVLGAPELDLVRDFVLRNK